MFYRENIDEVCVAVEISDGGESLQVFEYSYNISYLMSSFILV